jgi:hypothetical protein
MRQCALRGASYIRDLIDRFLSHPLSAFCADNEKFDSIVVFTGIMLDAPTQKSKGNLEICLNSLQDPLFIAVIDGRLSGQLADNDSNYKVIIDDMNDTE